MSILPIQFSKTLDVTGVLTTNTLATAVDVAELDAMATTGATNTDTTEGSFTVSSGTNRLLVLVISTTGTNTMTGYEYGGETMTRVLKATSTNGFPGTVDIFYLDEAGIAAAADTNFSAVPQSSVGGRFRSSAISFENVDQTNPVIGSGVSAIDNLNAKVMNMTTEAGGAVITGATVVAESTFTFSGVSEDISVESDAVMSYAAGSALTTGTSLTVDVDVVNSVSNSQEVAASIAIRRAA